MKVFKECEGAVDGSSRSEGVLDAADEPPLAIGGTQLPGAEDAGVHGLQGL